MEVFFCRVILIWHAKRSPFFVAHSTTGGRRDTRGDDEMVTKTQSEKNAEIKKLEQENETLLLCLELTFSAVELWAKQQGFIQSSARSEDELKQELSNRMDKIRTIFDKLIETSEPGFLNGLLSALNIPEEIQHLVKSRLIR